MEKRTYYDILEISWKASPEVVEMAYKALCRKYHPDVYLGADAHEIMVEINNAHDVLSNPEERKKYDRKLQEYEADVNEQKSDDDEDSEYCQDNDDEESNSIVEKASIAYELSQKCYDVIKETANSSAIVQAISGIVGNGVNIAVDVYALTNKLYPMIIKILGAYGKSDLLDLETAKSVIGAIKSEIIGDLVKDKVLGSIPIVGVYFNFTCAKFLTWRLGVLFTLFASADLPFEKNLLLESVNFLRKIMPKDGITKFVGMNNDYFNSLIFDAYFSDDIDDIHFLMNVRNIYTEREEKEKNSYIFHELYDDERECFPIMKLKKGKNNYAMMTDNDTFSDKFFIRYDGDIDYGEITYAILDEKEEEDIIEKCSELIYDKLYNEYIFVEV